MKLEIKEVVCDWGIYVDGETYPFMIFNSKANAQEIMRIMELDNKHERFDAVEYQKTCANNKYILGAMGLGKSASIKQVYEESQENCVYENSN
nr:hypothetical protein [Enterococcus faecium]HAQ7445531.1 hypothetical protein [Enterococcus faecium]